MGLARKVAPNKSALPPSGEPYHVFWLHLICYGINKFAWPKIAFSGQPSKLSAHLLSLVVDEGHAYLS